MKDLNYHHANLLSIKSINTQAWGDKLFFKNLVLGFIDKKQSIIVTARRPNDLLNTELLLDEAKLSGFVDIPYFYRDEIILQVIQRAHEDRPLELLAKYWVAYEHITITIKENSATIEKPKHLFKYTWTEMIQVMSASFVFFKGVEDDVIWIGKSPEIEFPSMNPLVSFKAKLY